MAQRTLALLALLAVITIGASLLQDRERHHAPAATASPSAPAEAEPTVALAVPEPTRETLQPAEARSEPPARSEIPIHAREDAPELSAPGLPAPETTEIVLVFRAVDTAGRPVLGELSVTTWFRWGRGTNSRGASASTDSTGRFEVRIDPSLLEVDRLELEIGARKNTLTARIQLGRALPSRRTDMGDLVLAPAPLVAEGRVIDAAGRPVAGATIVAHGSSRDGEIEPYFGAAETAADGVFAFHGSTSVASIGMRLDHERLRAAPLELPVGSSGIEIVAQESGVVSGQVLVDPVVPVGALRLILSPENQAGGARMESYDSSKSSSRPEVASDGRFQLRGLLPWSYTFSIATERDVLLQIPGIEVLPGEINQDPRLQALDLRGRLHAFELDLVRPSRSFQLSGSVCYTASGTRTPVRRQYFNKSPVVVVTPLTSIDALVRARECRLERLSDLGEHTEVRLRPAIPVRLVLPENVTLPAPPLFISATLEAADDPRSEERPRSYAEFLPAPPFDERGETVYQAAEPGPMKVRWFIERRDSGGGSRGQLDMPFEQIVMVEDREDEQRIELAITQQVLAAALSTR